MTPQELKNSILQMAIQGKLVEQRPEEGTAEELYQQIQTEKQKLIKEKKIKKDKPLPEITDVEKPFEIPESWKWVRLEEITYAVGNKSNQILAKEVKAEGQFPAVSQGAELIDGFCNDVDKVIYDLPVVMFGDHTRNVKYINFPFVISADGTKFMKILFADSRFIFYWMKITAEKLRNRGYARHYSLLKRELISLPPLAEQKRIVAKIEELLPLIDRYEAAWSRLEAFNKRFPEDMQKSILQEAIQGKLVEQRPEEGTGEELYQQIQAEKQRLIAEKKIKKDKPLPEITDDEKPFDIPGSWKWVRLGAVEEINLGFTYRPDYTQDGVYFLSVKDISSGKLDFSNAKKVSLETYENASYGSKPRCGDILFGRVGTMGKPQIITTDIPFCIFVSLGFLRDHTNIMDKKYISYWMQSYLFSIQVDKNVKGSAQKNLNTGWLKNFLLPLPPLAEQKRIVAKLEQLLPLCDKLK